LMIASESGEPDSIDRATVAGGESERRAVGGVQHGLVERVTLRSLSNDFIQS